jgi:myo-inositol-1(or 4)-monophosphatase
LPSAARGRHGPRDATEYEHEHEYEYGYEVPMSSPPPSPFLAFAIDAVRRAGETQRAAFGRGFAVSKKGAIDLVTEIDVAIERDFRTHVAEAWPGHGVLGEEFGATPSAGVTHWWIFDPIDGTTNFAHGLPIFCASLALEIDGVLAVGAVYDPMRDELFSAERGRGAWLNGERLAVSANASLGDALLVTGFPYSVQTDGEELLGLFARFIGKARAVRRLGSAALDVCYVAAGRMDGFWEQGLGPWDIAAAALIVDEAGGTTTDLEGHPFAARSGRLVASNGLVHREMLDTIATFHAERARNRTD